MTGVPFGDWRQDVAIQACGERVKSLFNCEDGHTFSAEFEIPDDALRGPWRIGLVVGPSGSGKTSLGQRFGPFWKPRWPARKPVNGSDS